MKDHHSLPQYLTRCWDVPFRVPTSVCLLRFAFPFIFNYGSSSSFPVTEALQVFAIEFGDFAIEFVPFAIEFVAFAIEFVPFAIEFVPFAIEFVGFAIEFVPFAIEFVAFAIEFVAFAVKFVHNKNGSWSKHENMM